MNQHELYLCVFWSAFRQLRGLKDPKSFIGFLKAADIRLVRLEFLLELHKDGLAMPRRQEAETMCTKTGATALVTLEEYEKLLVNENTGMACSSSIVCLMLLMRLIRIFGIYQDMLTCFNPRINSPWVDEVGACPQVTSSLEVYPPGTIPKMILGCTGIFPPLTWPWSWQGV